MTVNDVIEYVKYSELANFGIIKNLSSDYPIEIKDAEKAIISYINLGLIELYKRFNLRTEETTVTMRANTTIYPLSIPTLNFIEGVYNEKGEEYSLNDENDALSILMPSYNTIQVPNPSDGDVLFIVYSASPDTLIWNEDLNSLTVPIPPVLYEALFKYIGYRAVTGMTKDAQTDVQIYYTMFEGSCNKAISLGAAATDDGLTSAKKLEWKGFI